MPEKFSQQIQTKQQLIPQKNKHATQYNLESANLTKNTHSHGKTKLYISNNYEIVCSLLYRVRM